MMTPTVVFGTQHTDQRIVGKEEIRRYYSSRLPHLMVLCRLWGHTAMCTFGIDELRQQSAKILFFWRNAKEHTFGAHLSVEGLYVGDSEPKFDLSCWVHVGSRVKRQSGFARCKFTPAGRFESKLETQCVTVEPYRFVHVCHEFDHVTKLCFFHFDFLH